MNVNIPQLKDGKIQPRFISNELFAGVVADVEREIYVIVNSKHSEEYCAYARFKKACCEIGLEPPRAAYGDNFFEDNYRGSWVEVYKAWILVNSMK